MQGADGIGSRQDDALFKKSSHGLSNEVAVESIASDVNNGHIVDPTEKILISEIGLLNLRLDMIDRHC